jgi:hypothetical protein
MDKAYTLTMGGRTWAVDCPKVPHSADDTIEPNVYNDFGTIDGTRTITKGKEKPYVVNIYIIRFTAGADCALELEGWSCRWVGGNEPTYTEGNVYEISIIDDLAMYVEGSV